MIKLYKQIIELIVKNAKSRAEEQGTEFDQDKFTKKQEAILPIIFFYIVIWILQFISPGIFRVDLYLIILLFLIIKGLNHYYGWIRIIKKT
tara:strand:+ start:610 stop:882 length:273 start_codon:yes stop_codon:yes gene_type:complete